MLPKVFGPQAKDFAPSLAGCSMGSADNFPLPFVSSSPPHHLPVSTGRSGVHAPAAILVH
jgi:hypothetical protein